MSTGYQSQIAKHGSSVRDFLGILLQEELEKVQIRVASLAVDILTHYVQESQGSSLQANTTDVFFPFQITGRSYAKIYSLYYRGPFPLG